VVAAAGNLVTTGFDEVGFAKTLEGNPASSVCLYDLLILSDFSSFSVFVGCLRTEKGYCMYLLIRNMYFQTRSQINKRRIHTSTRS